MSNATRRVAVFVTWAAALAAGVTAAADPARLGWLEGRWTGEKDGVSMEEVWTAPTGGALLGLHRDVKAGRMVSFEFFRIQATKDGTVYFASPGAAPATPFKMILQADRKVTFENASHDFPQRILYWLDDKNALHARIEGTQDGKELHEEWVWTKKP